MFDKSAYMTEYMQGYRRENKESIAKAQKSWQERNKEHLREYMREYRARKKLESQKEI